eukprot:TRINITY_DN18050_c0_g1_i1.p1 TRINITY_DN18050_c0_g1~~TRINITY_DN18050_c0_g1_i1.p1  ORF type:complete len:219 (-),score=36.94 TRINITY_DN18050_c0_g1_i1:104-760(-)
MVSACQKDSQDITDADRDVVVQHIRETPRGCRVLVSHGTDTMIQTANYVAARVNCVQSKQVIMFTGALKPAKFRGSDASFNVGCAVGALGCAAPGVYIAMSGTVLQCHEAARNPEGHFVRKPCSNPVAQTSAVAAASSDTAAPSLDEGALSEGASPETEPETPPTPQFGPPSKTTLNVNAGAMRTITIPVEAGHCIVWKITVAHFDIGFSVRLSLIHI